MSTANTNQMTTDAKDACAERYNTLLSLFDLLEPNKWPNNVTAPWTDGEKRLKELSKVLKYDIPVNDFRDYIDNRDSVSGIQPPETIKRARKIIQTIAVSSAEAERGFSVMNDIATNERNKLLVINLSNLMSIKLDDTTITTEQNQSHGSQEISRTTSCTLLVHEK
jgi:hypothetical protein